MKNSIYDLAKEYVEFFVEGKNVKIPYCMVLQPDDEYDPTEVTRTPRLANFGAKGSAAQIRQVLTETAAAKHFDLKKASAAQIRQFMLQNGIGVDCSGFVYNVLDKYVQQYKSTSLGKQMFRFAGLKGWLENRLLQKNRVRRISAATLTSDLNSVKIVKVKEMQPGDMIRLTDPHWRGKHIAILVSVTLKEIIYAHSSALTEFTGPHFAKIMITNPELGLEKQQWLEKMKSGKNYGKHRFVVEKGDSVRRLKIFC